MKKRFEDFVSKNVEVTSLITKNTFSPQKVHFGVTSFRFPLKYIVIFVVSDVLFYILNPFTTIVEN